MVLKPNRTRGETTHTVSPGTPVDGRTAGQPDWDDAVAGVTASGRAGATGAAVPVSERGVVSPAARPPVRRSGLGGNKMLGRISTMSIRMNARMTRRSTGPLGACASARLCV